MPRGPTKLYEFAVPRAEAARRGRRPVEVIVPRPFKFRASQYTILNASSVAIPENLERQYLLIQNNGTVNVTLAFDAVDPNSVTFPGLVLLPGQSYEPLGIAPTNQLILITGATGFGVSVTVVEA